MRSAGSTRVCNPVELHHRSQEAGRKKGFRKIRERIALSLQAPPCSQSHVKKSEKEGSDGALWNFPVAFFEKRTFEEQRKMNRLRESQSLCIEAQRVCLDPPGTR